MINTGRYGKALIAFYIALLIPFVGTAICLVTLEASCFEERQGYLSEFRSCSRYILTSEMGDYEYAVVPATFMEYTDNGDIYDKYVFRMEDGGYLEVSGMGVYELKSKMEGDLLVYKDRDAVYGKLFVYGDDRHLYLSGVLSYGVLYVVGGILTLLSFFLFGVFGYSRYDDDGNLGSIPESYQIHIVKWFVVYIAVLFCSGGNIFQMLGVELASTAIIAPLAVYKIRAEAGRRPVGGLAEPMPTYQVYRLPGEQMPSDEWYVKPSEVPQPSERTVRARELLRKTVGEEAFAELESGSMIAVKASNGWTYGVDMKGNIGKRKASRLFDTKKIYGTLKSDSLPIEDLVASFFVWAKSNPEDLEKKWGCGNITINDKTKR